MPATIGRTKRSEKGLLTPDNCVVALIDHQPQMMFGVAGVDRQSIINNTVALGKAARVFDVPVVLTTVETKSFSGNLSSSPRRTRGHAIHHSRHEPRCGRAGRSHPASAVDARNRRPSPFAPPGRSSPAPGLGLPGEPAGGRVRRSVRSRGRTGRFERSRPTR